MNLEKPCPYVKETLTLIKVVDGDNVDREEYVKLANIITELGIPAIQDRSDIIIETINIQNTFTECIVLRSNGIDQKLSFEELREMCEDFDEPDATDIKILTSDSTILKSVC